MITDLLLFGLGAFVACCLVLGIMCVVHFTTNPYSMNSAMQELKERCETKDGTVKKLNEPTVDIKFFMKPKMNIKAAEDKRR